MELAEALAILNALIAAEPAFAALFNNQPVTADQLRLDSDQETADFIDLITTINGNTGTVDDKLMQALAALRKADGATVATVGVGVGGKLGKKAARHDPRTLRLTRYFRHDLPAAPASVDYGGSILGDWGMLANNIVGDCTIAAAAHLTMAWCGNVGVTFLPSEDQVLAAYSNITGYNPADPDSDQGAVELDVLKYWRKQGIAAHSIAAFTSVNPQDAGAVRQAIYLFEGLYIGLNLPLTAQGKTLWEIPPGGWTSENGPGSWGGHAVCIVGYDAEGLTIITWGQKQRMTWGFFHAACDEAYALLSDDMLDTNRRAPVGLDMGTLRRDLQAI